MPTCHGRQTSAVDQPVAVLAQDRGLDACGVGAGALDHGGEMGGHGGGEFGCGAHVGDDLVVVGEEGGDEAGADVAGCAEEEDFHVDCLVDKLFVSGS